MLRHKWHFFWNNQNIKLNQIKKSTSRCKNSKLEENRETILTQLRIGHTRLTYGFRRTKEPPYVLMRSIWRLCSQ